MVDRGIHFMRVHCTSLLNIINGKMLVWNTAKLKKEAVSPLFDSAAAPAKMAFEVTKNGITFCALPDSPSRRLTDLAFT